MNNSGCTLLSIPIRIASCTSSSLRRGMKRLPRCSSENSARNISSMTLSLWSILYRGYKQHSTDTASITDSKNRVIGTALNGMKTGCHRTGLSSNRGVRTARSNCGVGANSMPRTLRWLHRQSWLNSFSRSRIDTFGMGFSCSKVSPDA